MGFESKEHVRFLAFIQRQKEEERAILQSEEDQMSEGDAKATEYIRQGIAVKTLAVKTTERENQNSEHKNEEDSQTRTTHNDEESVESASLRGTEVLGDESSPTGGILNGSLPEPDSEPYEAQLQQESDRNEDRITGLETEQEDEKPLQIKGIGQDLDQEEPTNEQRGLQQDSDQEEPTNEQRGLQQDSDQSEDRITGLDASQEDEKPPQLELILDNEDSEVEPSDITKKQDVEQEDRSFPVQGINELASSIMKDLEQQNQKYLMELDSLFSNDSPESDIDSLVARSFI